MQYLKHSEKDIYIPDATEETQNILQLINKFGAVYDTQVKRLLQVHRADEVMKYNYCLEYILLRNDRILFDEANENNDRKIYPLSYYGRIPEDDIPECLWNVCHRMRHRQIKSIKDVQLAEEPGCIFYPEAVTNIREDQDGNTVEQKSHEIVMDVYIDDDNLWKVPYLQERYFARARKREDGSVHGHTTLNIVVNDMSVASRVLDTCAVSMPMYVTLVDHKHPDASGMPKVSRRAVD